MGKKRKKKSAPHEMLTGIGALLAGIAALITAIVSIFKD